MQSELEVKSNLKNVDCAPFLQRLILEDPDPSSPLYIPKPPPRRYETLSEALKAGTVVDHDPDATERSAAYTGGVNIRDDRAAKARRKREQKTADALEEDGTSNVQRQMADFHRGMDFVQDDPFSMGNPFGGRSFGGEGGGWEEDEFGGIGESQYPDTPHYNEEAESQYIKEQQNQYSEEFQQDQSDMTGEENENEEEGEDEEGDEQGGYVQGEEEEEEDDESGYRQSAPMFAPGDEQLMEDARNLRERDGIPYHDSQDSVRDNADATGYEDPVAEGTSYSEKAEEGAGPGGGSELVENQEDGRPRRKLKEKFRKDREELEKRLNEGDDYMNRNTPQGEGDPDDPSAPPGEGGSRIMSGRELQQQMAMQQLAAAALKAISSRGKGKGGKGKRGGKVRVVFM